MCYRGQCLSRWSLTLLSILVAVSLGLGTAAADHCQRQGDVDNSNSRTPMDALMAFKHYLHVQRLESLPDGSCQLMQADVINSTSRTPIDPESDITPADALCIFRKYLGVESCIKPVVTVPPPQNHPVGASVNLQIMVTALGDENLTYAGPGLSALGLTINAQGLITGIVTATPGTYPITITVADGPDAMSVEFPWTVHMPAPAVPDGLTWRESAPPPITVNTVNDTCAPNLPLSVQVLAGQTPVPDSGINVTFNLVNPPSRNGVIEAQFIPPMAQTSVGVATTCLHVGTIATPSTTPLMVHATATLNGQLRQSAALHVTIQPDKTSTRLLRMGGTHRSATMGASTPFVARIEDQYGNPIEDEEFDAVIAGRDGVIPERLRPRGPAGHGALLARLPNPNGEVTFQVQLRDADQRDFRVTIMPRSTSQLPPALQANFRVFVGEPDIPGMPADLAVVDNTFVLVADSGSNRDDRPAEENRPSTLQVITISDPGNPSLRHQRDLDGTEVRLAIASGRRAYVATNAPARLYIVSTDNLNADDVPTRPPLGQIDFVEALRSRMLPDAAAALQNHGITGLAVQGEFAYVLTDAQMTAATAAMGGTLQIVHIPPPNSPMANTPSLTGSFNDIQGHPQGIAVSGNFAYVPAGTAGLLSLDISNPASPKLAGTLPGDGANGGFFSGIALAQNRAYVVETRAQCTPSTPAPAQPQHCFTVLDVGTNPLLPQRLGSVAVRGEGQTGGAATIALDLERSFAFVVQGAFGVQVIDISLPAAPRLVPGMVEPPSAALNVATAEARLFFTDQTDGLVVHPNLITRSDTDGDTSPDFLDVFSNDPAEWQDSDGDGLGDNADLDDDNDGVSDADETQAGTDPTDPRSITNARRPAALRDALTTQQGSHALIVEANGDSASQCVTEAGGGIPLRSITEALAELRTLPADATVSLTICAGTYSSLTTQERFPLDFTDVPASLTVRGAGTPGTPLSTVIDAGFVSDVLVVQPATRRDTQMTFERLKLIHGRRGMSFTRAAGMTLRDNVVLENMADGVFIGSNASVTLAQNTISTNGGFGILVEGGATATIAAQTQILHNGFSGVLVANRATATLQDSSVRDNRGSGVAVLFQSSATLTDNMIMANGLDGILLADATAVMTGNSIQNNGILDNGGGGIFALFATATISTNSITDNRLEGMLLFGVSQTTLTANTLSNNGSASRRFCGASTAAAGLGLAGIQLCAAEVTINAGSVNMSAGHGIAIESGSVASIARDGNAVNLSGNSGAGIFLDASSSLTLNRALIDLAANTGGEISSSASGDADFDGLTDALEQQRSTDPLLSDTDGDRLVDGFEVTFAAVLDPLIRGTQSAADPDADGLTNLEEQGAGTDPTKTDTDADGLSDGAEVKRPCPDAPSMVCPTNPLQADTDGDGLSDGAEVTVHLTDPLRRDTDGGGRTDGDEVTQDGSDPRQPADDIAVAFLPQTLIDGSGFQWDINPDGSVADGSRDAFDGGLQLLINDEPFPPSSMAFLEGNEARELRLGPLRPARSPNLLVTRKVFVPGNAALARYLEIVENDSSTEAFVSVLVRSNLGSDSATEIVATSSGDRLVTTLDRFLITDDGDAIDDPTVTHIFAGPNAMVQPVAVVTDAPRDNVSFTFRVNIPPRKRAIIMHFATQSANRQDAMAGAVRLEHLLDSALAELSGEEQAAIVNFFAFPDADEDGLNDVDEASLGTTPDDPDTDDDGLLDGFEVRSGLNPRDPADGSTDLDNDGLTNFEEQTNQTDPTRADTDADELSDAAEVNTHLTNPRIADTDEDGLSDGAEVNRRCPNPNDPNAPLSCPTNPLQRDTDGGGRTDGQEVTQDSTDPLDPDDDSAMPVLYSISPREPVLRVVDQSTAATVSQVPVTLPGASIEGGTGLATHPGTGALWALLKSAGEEGRVLAVIDPGTGVATRIGNTGDTFSGLTFDAQGTLYGVTGDGALAPEALFILSTIDATPTPVRGFGNGNDGEALAFNARDGRLYHASGNFGNVIFESVEPQQSPATAPLDIPLTVENALQAGEVFALTYSALDDVFLWAQGFSDHLFRVTASGTPTLVGPLDHESKGLALVLPDSDRDGLLDSFERQFGLDPNDPGDGPTDPDGDGLTNQQEQVARTDPTVADTDRDGLLDGFEVQFGLDPHDARDAMADPDRDGRTNLQEHMAGTSPQNPDSDSGGRNDGEEAAAGTNPLDPDDDLQVPSLTRELITNGGFEEGDPDGRPRGWIILDQGSGSWFRQQGTASPQNAFSVPAPPTGTFAALTDQFGPGTHVLYQELTLPQEAVAVTLAFDLYINNQAGAFFTPPSLVLSGIESNQQFRVDIVDAAADPFDAQAGVLAAVFRTEVDSPAVSGYTRVTVDLPNYQTLFAGRRVRLRFAEVDNQFFLTVGVDNVSVLAFTTQEDSDGDGLSDDEEQSLGTRADDPDTDDDGLEDGAEVALGTDPLRADTDGGGRNDAEEINEGTDPRDPGDDRTAQVVSLPLLLIDGADFLWDIQSDGQISDGGRNIDGVKAVFDAFDGGLQLLVNGTAFPAVASALTEDGERELQLGPVPLGALQVSRKIFVPTDDAMVRYLEIFTNPTGTPVTATVTVQTNLGSDSATVVVRTSSGDQVLTPADNWIITDDNDNTGDPTIVHVFSGPNAALEPRAVSTTVPGGDNVSFTFELSVPPGQQHIIMHFVSQSPNQLTATSSATLLEGLGGQAGDGLSAEERASVVNFSVDTVDRDNDGLSDAEEMALGTDPNVPDTDGDGLLDGFEVRFGFDPLAGGDDAQDTDADGLSNAQEQALGTDPTSPDSDGGGLSDGDEVAAGTNPLLSADDRPGVDLPQFLIDSAGFLWDIVGDGSIDDGSNDAFDGGLELLVNGEFFPFVASAAVEDVSENGDRELQLGPVTMGTLRVTRKIFVPTDDVFARYLEILDNPTSAPVTATVTVQTNLGSDFGTIVVSTSSGDSSFTAADTWIITDDSDGTGDPTVAHVFAGSGVVLRPQAVFSDAPSDSLSFTFSVLIPAGQRRIVMHFAAQALNRATARTSAMALESLGGSARSGLAPEELEIIVNFPVLDADNDGLSDADEMTHGTNPHQADTDSDGLLDGFEVRFGFDPLVGGDAAQDTDADGLSNQQEQALGSDPLNPDTDGGGSRDGIEDEAGTNPLDPTDDLPETPPDVFLPHTLIDSAGFQWDIQGDGSIADGSFDAFDGGLRLWVNGTLFPALSGALAEDEQRELALGPVTIDALRVSRKIFVPLNGLFVRYLEILENPTASPLTVTVSVESNLGSDSSTEIVITSDGDPFFDTLDHWIVTHDQGFGDPAVAHVFGGPNGALAPRSVVEPGFGFDDVGFTFEVTIPAGERRILMHFASQDFDLEFLQSTAVFLAEPGGVALDGLTASEQDVIVNFFNHAPLLTPPADQVSSAGESVLLQIVASDPEGAQLFFSATQLPPELSIDPFTGVITGTLSSMAPAGSPYTVAITVFDEVTSVTGFFSWTVLEPGLILPATLIDSTGFQWDIHGNGGIDDGSNDAFDGGLLLTVNTTPFPAPSNLASEDNGRELQLGPVSIDSLLVSRKIFVPTHEGFIRYLEILDNPTASTLTATVRVQSNLGSDSGTVVVQTSSGDTLFTPQDNWLITDDSDGTGDPTIVHLFSGPQAILEPQFVTPGSPSGDENVSVTFDLEIPPGQRRILMHFAVQQVNQAAALASAMQLEGLGGSALDGLDVSEQDAIVNFFLDPDADGLGNTDERFFGTDATNPDSDGGGRTDGDEVFIDGTNPLDPTDDQMSFLSLPITLTDGAGFQWDIQDDGSINDGSNDAFDGGLLLLVDDLFFPFLSSAGVEDGGRELVLGPVSFGSLLVGRKIFVSTHEGFIRYLEILDNLTTSTLTATVHVESNLGSDLDTVVVLTSNGNDLFSTFDDWLITDDTDGTGDPTIVHVFSNPGASLEPQFVTPGSSSGDQFVSFTFEVSVPPGQRRILMHFAAQSPDQATATAVAMRLEALQGSALQGLTSDERNAIVNFSVPSGSALTSASAQSIPLVPTVHAAPAAPASAAITAAALLQPAPAVASSAPRRRVADTAPGTPQNPAGTLPGRATPRPGHTDIAVGSDGSLWLLSTLAGHPAVLQVDPATGQRTAVATNASAVAGTFGAPLGLAVEADGTLWVLDTEATHAGRTLGPAVWRVEPTTGARTVVAANSPDTDSLGAPLALAIDPHGTLWVLDAAAIDRVGRALGPAVWRVEPTTGTRSAVALQNPAATSTVGTPVDITIETDGTLWVLDAAAIDRAGRALGPAVWRLEPTTGRHTMVALHQPHGGAFATPLDLALDEASGELLMLTSGAVDAADTRGHAVWRLDRTTGIATLIASYPFLGALALITPCCMAVEAAGSLVLVDADRDALVRIDMHSGESTFVSP